MENIDNLVSWQEEVDYIFMQRVRDEVTQSCALPLAVPLERIPAIIVQAAQWFWLNCDWASEERFLGVRNEDIVKCNTLNKYITLPAQILAVHGVYKTKNNLNFSTMGDFSLERMMMTTYNAFGGAGMMGGGFSGTASLTGYNILDVSVSMYEIDTFNQQLNTPLTYDYNMWSHKLILLGNLGGSDLLINCFKRCKIQDLYNNYYFFRMVVCFVKRSLGTIYGTFEYKLPGGVTINYSNITDEANTEIDEIKEWVSSHNGVSYFFQPNTI